MFMGLLPWVPIDICNTNIYLYISTLEEDQ